VLVVLGLEQRLQPRDLLQRLLQFLGPIL
jgi:hypothetical protein